jgi:hypothetical protein
VLLLGWGKWAVIPSPYPLPLEEGERVG